MKRTLTFTILAWLTWINVLALMVIALLNWLMPNETGDTIKILGLINSGLVFSDIPESAYYVPVLISLIMAGLGVLLVYRDRKIGRWLTFLGLLLVASSLAVPMILLGQSKVSLLIVVCINLILAGAVLFVKPHRSSPAYTA